MELCCLLYIAVDFTCTSMRHPFPTTHMYTNKPNLDPQSWDHIELDGYVIGRHYFGINIYYCFWEPFRQERPKISCPPSIPPFARPLSSCQKNGLNSWNSKNWNWHDQQWNQGQEAWTQPETWQSQEVPPPKIRTPPEWKSTSTMYDDELLYGHKFHKTIQPTAWSRRKNICGLNPLTVPIGLLTRHGASEFGLRLLSEGRFLGIITTRSIAESVFGAQLLKAMRDQGVDIDTLSEHLHRTADPDAPIPVSQRIPLVSCLLWFMLLFPN